ncbi:hypothetical protein [Paracoccus sediminilitoris]|uniref:hypothetical protein n=1 Tax=Paracoccus sediminilitoris TaxID=2202419 RepID=UPI00272D2C1F|nr:hypothetical protein [Paracoccus sediminilitoris]
MIPEQNSRKLIQALEYLRDHGLTIDQLCDLHHNPKRAERFGAAISYRNSPPQEYQEPNITYHQRLLFVAAEHWRTEAGFDALVSQARAKFPDVVF